MTPCENSPTVSIVITTYQRPVVAMRAIRSALAQDYPNKKVYIIEDGPETELKQIIAGLNLNHVFYISHSKNQGLASARNSGIRCSDGEYIAFLDDDDEWMQTKISEQIELALNADENCACIYCAAYIVEANGRILGENRPRLRGSIKREIEDRGLHTIPSSCLFKRDILIKVGGYDETLKSHIDHDIWMSLAKNDYGCDFTSTVLVKAYEHNESRITNHLATRIEATRKFCGKWKPELIAWYGEKTAKQYLSRFQARVFIMIGNVCRKNGQNLDAFRYYFTALWFDPRNHKCYRNLWRLISS